MVQHALHASLNASRGIYKDDKRFKWKVIVPCDNAVKDVSEHRRTYGMLQGDTLVIQMLLQTLSDCLQDKFVWCLGGSTGMKCAAQMSNLGSTTDINTVFPPSDLDVDVFAASGPRLKEALDQIERACTDMLRKGDIVKEICKSIGGAHASQKQNWSYRTHEVSRQTLYSSMANVSMHAKELSGVQETGRATAEQTHGYLHTMKAANWFPLTLPDLVKGPGYHIPPCSSPGTTPFQACTFTECVSESKMAGVRYR